MIDPNKQEPKGPRKPRPMSQVIDRAIDDDFGLSASGDTPKVDTGKTPRKG